MHLILERLFSDHVLVDITCMISDRDVKMKIKVIKDPSTEYPRVSTEKR